MHIRLAQATALQKRGLSLSFESDAGTRAPLNVNTLAELETPIELNAGTWTLILRGYTLTPENKLIAEGSVEITVMAGKTRSAAVTLLPAGQGRLDYRGLLSAIAGFSPRSASLSVSAIDADVTMTLNANGDNGYGGWE